jgi:DNA-binding NtrC family response regulator
MTNRAFEICLRKTWGAKGTFVLRPQTASNGLEALQILGTHLVDLVLLDVVMPGMTGPTLFQNLEEHYPDVAVIFITAMDDLNLAVEHLKSGAYDYIVKPVSLIRLLRAVETSLGKHKEKFENEQQSTHLEQLVVHQSQALRNKQRELTALNHMIQNPTPPAAVQLMADASQPN